MGLLGVVTALAMRISDEFESHILHQCAFIIDIKFLNLGLWYLSVQFGLSCGKLFGHHERMERNFVTANIFIEDLCYNRDILKIKSSFMGMKN